MREDLARSFRGQLQQEMSYIVSGIGQVIKEGKEATIDTGALRELLDLYERVADTAPVSSTQYVAQHVPGLHFANPVGAFQRQARPDSSMDMMMDVIQEIIKTQYGATQENKALHLMDLANNFMKYGLELDAWNCVNKAREIMRGGSDVSVHTDVLGRREVGEGGGENVPVDNGEADPLRAPEGIQGAEALQALGGDAETR